MELLQEISSSLNRLKKGNQQRAQASRKSAPATLAKTSPIKKISATESRPESEPSKENFIEIDDEELAIQARIIKNRRKLLWPGIWTFFAIAGTYGTLAYLDVKFNQDVISGTTELPERTVLPQTWYLTPTVVKDGLIAGWQELDKLTIGIVIASVAIHFMKRSPLPFWEKLIHITGEKKYTTFTYPFVHSTWSHVGNNMFALCWFLPAVVHYLDGDVFHAAAVFITVPLLTSYLQHFVFRWGATKGLPLNMGASGSIAAIFGAFCMAYSDEKVWTPPFIVVRLDAKYWAALFAATQFIAMVQVPKGGNRPAFAVHLFSLGLGAAYIYFDAKDNIWKPLIEQFSKDNPVPVKE
ncbi:hypothetical protein IQ07DRAFT_523938 [Pyrenochaeta sp. DS3sAY3a]|nr:hypothetical protein IQ07DRAFT_523938 [Pyrenochaeta sp. DS3sAY3a]